MGSRPFSSGFAYNNLAPTMALNALETRASNTCPSGNYTTPVGQIFSTTFGNAGCGRDLPFDDFAVVQQEDITSLTDCMDYCSENAHGVAYGVSYQFEATPGMCHCKNSSALNEGYESNLYVHTALTVNVNHLDQDCQYPNGSIRDAIDGSQYRIYCNQDMIAVDDMCPSTSPTGNGTEICPTHANSLQDCMDQCSLAHPLCRAVTYHPSMIDGYGNCYFKSNISAQSFEAWNRSNDMRHMAVLSSNVGEVNSSCVNGTNYTSPLPRLAEFTVTCNFNNPVSDIITYHTQNMSACADICATYYNSSGITCAGVMFDSVMDNGWQNCYIKGSFATLEQSDGAHWLQLVQASSNSNSANSSSGDTNATDTKAGGSNVVTATPPQSLRLSKVWIAGPVSAALAGAAAIIAFIFWLARRLRRSSPIPTSPQVRGSEGKQVEQQQKMSEEDVLEAFPESALYEADLERIMHEAGGDQVLQELGGRLVLSEMPETHQVPEWRSPIFHKMPEFREEGSVGILSRVVSIQSYC